MAHGFQTPRHLDDPVKPFFGLSLLQLLGTIVALGIGGGAFILLSGLPLQGFVAMEVHVIGAALVATPLLFVVLVFGGDRIEPLTRQQWGYLRRPHRYAPVSTPAEPTPTHTPAPARQQAREAPAAGLFPCEEERGLTISDDGVITLPDGGLRAILRVDGIALECCSVSEQDVLAGFFGNLANSLVPGQTLQVLVESQPIDADAVVREVFHDLRPSLPALREFTTLWRPWLERQLRRGHVPNLTFYLVLSPAPVRTLDLTAGVGSLRHHRDQRMELRAMEQAIDDTGRHLKRIGLSCRRLGRGPALKLLWASFHLAGAACPTQQELDQGTETELAARARAAQERQAQRAAHAHSARMRLIAIPRAAAAGLAPPLTWTAQRLPRPATAHAGALPEPNAGFPMAAPGRSAAAAPRRQGRSAPQAGLLHHPIKLPRALSVTRKGKRSARSVSTETGGNTAREEREEREERDNKWKRPSVRWRRRPASAPAPDTKAQEIGAELLRARLCGVEVQESQLKLTVDGVLSRSMFLLRPPDVTSPGWLDVLVSLDCPFRLAIHMEGLDREAERRKLKRKRRQLNVVNMESATSSGIADVDMGSAQREAAQLIGAMRDTRHGLVHTGVYLTVLARDSERLADYAAHAGSAITTRLGGELGRGIGHQLPLWQSTLPLGVDAASRRYRLPSETVGNAFPFLTHSPGMRHGYPLGFSAIGNELVMLDPADPGLPNALMNLVGRSGSGKTFLALKLILYTLLLGGRATVVDRAGHYQTLLRAVDGSLAPLGARDNPPALNMWDYAGGTVDGNKIGWIVDAHEIMLATQAGDRLNAVQRAILEQGVRHVYAAHHDGSIPLERELHMWLEHEEKNTARPVAERLLVRELAAGLLPYVHDGRFAPLLDRPTTVDLESRLLVFDLADLGSNQNIQALAMLLIAEAVERRAKHRTLREGADPSRVRELLVIDEGWFLVKYGAGGAWIEQVARQGRHWGLFLCFITQQLSDLVNDPTAASLFNAASCQLLFRQKDEGAGPESGLRWLSKILGLSDEEVHQMQQLSGVRGEYTEMFLIRESKDAATARRGIVRVIAHPAEYWMFSSEPLRDRPRRERMIKACGGDVWAAVKALAAGQEPEDIAAAPDSGPPLTGVG